MNEEKKGEEEKREKREKKREGRREERRKKREEEKTRREKDTRGAREQIWGPRRTGSRQVSPRCDERRNSTLSRSYVLEPMASSVFMPGESMPASLRPSPRRPKAPQIRESEENSSGSRGPSLGGVMAGICENRLLSAGSRQVAPHQQNVHFGRSRGPRRRHQPGEDEEVSFFLFFFVFCFFFPCAV